MTKPITDEEIQVLKAQLEVTPHFRPIFLSFLARVEADAFRIQKLEEVLTDVLDGMEAADIRHVTGLPLEKCQDIVKFVEPIFKKRFG